MILVLRSLDVDAVGWAQEGWESTQQYQSGPNTWKNHGSVLLGMAMWDCKCRKELEPEHLRRKEIGSLGITKVWYLSTVWGTRWTSWKGFRFWIRLRIYCTTNNQGLRRSPFSGDKLHRARKSSKSRIVSIWEATYWCTLYPPGHGSRPHVIQLWSARRRFSSTSGQD